MTIAVKPDRATRAYHDFLLGAKLYWSADLYQKLHATFESERAAHAKDFADVDDAERELRKTPIYRTYSWFERNLQRLKYASPRGILAAVDEQREDLTAALDDAAREGEERGLLKLDPNFIYPDYYSKVDFHQHPGGVWSDPLAGFAYEFGRRTTTPLHIDPGALHELMAAAAPTGDFERILDWGCGTGGSTLPFAKLYPDAELYAIDLAAPCLKLAYMRAAEKGVDVQWSQQRMEHTNFPDEQFDLIHSTFLPHELPRQAMSDIVNEAYRILKPGGWFVNLDFHTPPGGVWGQLIHYGHARRNNEVFMRSFCETDFIALQKGAGFSSAEMCPFDDGTGLVEPDQVPPKWRFPWQLFVAQK